MPRFGRLDYENVSPAASPLRSSHNPSIILMSSDPAASTLPTPNSKRHSLRIWRWLLLAVFVTSVYGVWRQRDLQAAIDEAKVLGWNWAYDDPYEAIQKDWTAAFRKKTWLDGKRDLTDIEADDVARHGKLIRRLGPRYLRIQTGSELTGVMEFGACTSLRKLELFSCAGLTNLDGFKELTGLRELNLAHCLDLKNVDGLEGLSKLESLNLGGCSELTNLNGLKRLPALQQLSLAECEKLTSFDALERLSKLQLLDLTNCIGLTSMAPLRKLSHLKKLKLYGCTGLHDINALKNLTGLQSLHLVRCTGITKEAVIALKAALPNTAMRYPWDTSVADPRAAAVSP
jgi:Leucine-rich repeat (LRR) protein